MTDRVERHQLYADLLLQLLRAEDPSGSAADELYRFARAFEQNDSLRETLTDLSIPAPRRMQVVEELLGGHAHQMTVGIVAMLTASGRAYDLPKIVDTMVAKDAAEGARALAEVRSATPLTPDQESRLSEALEKSVGRPVELKVIVDPTVLGGVVAEIGDTVIDGSVRTRLAQLREAL